MNDKFALKPLPRQRGPMNLLLPFYKPERIYHLQKLSFALEKHTEDAGFLSDIFYVEAFYIVLLRKQNIQGLDNKKSQIHVRISQLEGKFPPPNIDLLPEGFKQKYTRLYDFPATLKQISRDALNGRTKFLIKTADKQLALAIAKAFALRTAQPLVYGDSERCTTCCEMFDQAVGFGGNFGSICFKAGMAQEAGWEILVPVPVK